MNFAKTEILLSQVHARDGIFVDSVCQSYKDSSLTFAGEIRGEAVGFRERYRRFRLIFSIVSYYNCIDIDFSSMDAGAVSNFCIIQDSEYIKANQLMGYHHYYLSSYDYAYEIVAKEVEFRF